MRWPTFFISLLAASCSTPAPNDAVSPAAVLENVEAWDGKTVIVEGWLGTCAGLDCQIHQTRRDMEVVKADNSGEQEWSAAMNRSISIGFSEQFDQAASPLQFSFVRIRAKISKECWPHRCKDRADILRSISIEPADAKKAGN